jgi:NitT/TauT family transport system permease protein
VTHNVREAVRLGDRVVLLSSRPGRIAQTYDVAIGTPAASSPGGRPAVGRDHRRPARRDPAPRGPAVTAPSRASTADDLASLEAGLDALDAPQEARPSRVQAFSTTWPPLVAIALLLVVWELVYRAEIKPTYALPSPADVGLVLLEQLRNGTLLEAIGTSITRGGVGFVVAVLIGTPLGLLVGRVQAVRRGIGPIISGLQCLPSVAWVPAAIIFFGLGEGAIYAVVLLGAVPSIANGMVSGIDQVPPLFLRVGRVLGARGLSSARFVVLPAVLPAYLGGPAPGLGLLVALAHGRRAHRQLARARPGARLAARPRPPAQRHEHGVRGILGILVVGIAVELCLFAPLERRVLRRRGLLVGR